MLLETKRGKENKVPIDDSAIPALVQHTWTRELGYHPDPNYRPALYPKMLHKPRLTGAAAAKNVLLAILNIKDEKERRGAYLKAVADLGDTGADIRQFPIEVPEPDVMRSLLRIIVAKLEAHEKEEWLALNANKTNADFKVFMKSPLELTVKSQEEESQALKDGWQEGYDFSRRKN